MYIHTLASTYSPCFDRKVAPRGAGGPFGQNTALTEIYPVCAGPLIFLGFFFFRQCFSEGLRSFLSHTLNEQTSPKGEFCDCHSTSTSEYDVFASLSFKILKMI